MKRKASTPEERHRLHVQRMLKRAERKERQASRLVLKWRKVLADLGREDPLRQPMLWESLGAVEQKGPLHQTSMERTYG